MNTPEHLPVMTENRKQLNIMLLKLLHLALTTVIFYVCWLLFRYGRLTGMSKYAFRYNYYVAAGFVACVVFFNRTYNAYLLGYMRIRTLAVSQFMSQFFSTGLMWLVVCVAWKHWDDPLFFLFGLVVMLVLDAAWSYFANGYFFRLYPPKKTLVIYRNELDRKRVGSVRGKPAERLYKVAEEFQYDGYSFKEIRDRLKGYEAIVVAGVHSRCR